uniref:Uncharacterized protein n=1 Tax=Kalmanozyma brasiliensis (strain GHG001) TaxID=1365824 RepID=V5GTE0_KALBG
MATQLDQVKRDLVGGSSVGPTSKPPQWLHKLLGTVPGLPADAVPHNRPKHAELQAAIAEAAYHPAIEACLHLINREKGGTLDLESLNDLPRQVQLTAHGHIDLVFLTTLAQKAATSSAVGSDAVQRDIEKHHRSTTEAEDKIKASQSAFALDELQSLFEKLVDSESAQKAVRGVTQLELLWMLSAMVEDFGWRHYGMADAVEALKVESTPAHQSLDDDRKSKASNMVFNPSQGQRIF